MLIYVNVRDEDIARSAEARKAGIIYSPVRKAIWRAWNLMLAPETKLPERPFALNHKRFILYPPVLSMEVAEANPKGLNMRCSEWLMYRVRMLDSSGTGESFDFYMSIPDEVAEVYRTMGSGANSVQRTLDVVLNHPKSPQRLPDISYSKQGLH